MITGNKGEWSEFYTFLKVLDERMLFFADADLNKLKEYYPVVGVIREERAQTGKIYRFNGNNVDVTNFDNSLLGSVERIKIKSCISKIFETMNASEGSFSVPVVEDLMSDLFCTQIKAGNTDKADLTAEVKEQGSPMIVKLGFSIKSMIGGAATLLNASGATNFVYKVEHFNGNIERINAIEGRSKVRDRIKAIEDAGGKISFSSLANTIFKNNLKMIDVALPEITAKALLSFYKGSGSTILDACSSLPHDEELKKKYDLSQGDFEYKIKAFLRAVALGMVPNKEWNGLSAAHGGYLIVKENGDVVCYHLSNMDAFQEYLFRNTKFDTASTRRHRFGKIYEKDGNLFINLNLQIRFLR
jgi:type II restriction enzyme